MGPSASPCRDGVPNGKGTRSPCVNDPGLNDRSRNGAISPALYHRGLKPAYFCFQANRLVFALAASACPCVSVELKSHSRPKIPATGVHSLNGGCASLPK